jgi:hypothetical protein
VAQTLTSFSAAVFLEHFVIQLSLPAAQYVHTCCSCRRLCMSQSCSAPGATRTLHAKQGQSTIRRTHRFGVNAMHCQQTNKTRRSSSAVTAEHASTCLAVILCCMRRCFHRLQSRVRLAVSSCCACMLLPEGSSRLMPACSAVLTKRAVCHCAGVAPGTLARLQDTRANTLQSAPGES